MADARLDDHVAPLAQLFNVFAHGRVVVHPGVHGRRDDDRRRGGQQGSRNQVVCQTQRDLRKGMRRGRRDEHRIRALPERHVANLRLRQQGKHLDRHRPMGQGLKTERAN